MQVIKDMIAKGGPDKSDYDLINQKLVELANHEENTHKLCEMLYDILRPTLNVNTMQGFAHTKPHGYAGDFEMIDRIYQKWTSPDPSLSKWDDFFHNQAAPKAVRNRKEYFKSMAKGLLEKYPEGRINMLNIGSGPARDVHEFFADTGSERVFIDCVDIDARAIRYASELNRHNLDRITFHKKNIFRFQPQHSYQLIWSAGLFDYFTDQRFIRLVEKLYAFVEEGGELVIGNFSNDNPSRAYMEHVGEWVLEHRNEEELFELALKAGVAQKNITVGQESEGVNLFLHMRK